MEKIEMLINELESEILKSKRAPFSNTDIVINKTTVLDMLSRIRQNYPLALKEAAQICKQRDEIMEKAEAYANETMDKAEEQARQMISQNEIVRRAQESAQEIQSEATGHYQKMDYDARVLAFDLLNDVEKSIRSALVQINDRKNKLINE